MAERAPKTKTIRYRRWALRYPDGTYHALGGETGHGRYMERVKNPLDAELYETKWSAKAARDREGHLRGVAMEATQLKFTVAVVQRGALGAAAELPDQDEF